MCSYVKLCIHSRKNNSMISACLLKQQAVSPLFLSEMHSEENDSATLIQNNVQFPAAELRADTESHYGKGLAYEY